jgi:AbrB family looped-hinge helix DNA binding protein
MTEVEVIGEIDTKGRITIPKEIRDRYDLKPRDKIRIKVIEPLPRKSFMKECKGALKGSGDAVKLLHEESPFR